MSGFLPGPFGPPLVYRSICEWQRARFGWKGKRPGAGISVLRLMAITSAATKR
jgi:hypothetical protein